MLERYTTQYVRLRKSRIYKDIYRCIFNTDQHNLQIFKATGSKNRFLDAHHTTIVALRLALKFLGKEGIVQSPSPCNQKFCCLMLNIKDDPNSVYISNIHEIIENNQKLAKYCFKSVGANPNSACSFVIRMYIDDCIKI